jgi:DNA polymerase III epsilon subunit-like protein
MLENKFENLLFIDTETTGLEKEDKIFQVAYEFNGEEKNELFKPELKISIEAMETTHFTNKDVEEKPEFKNSPMEKDLQKIFEDTNNIFIAHNAKFDVKMLEKENLKVGKVIDTLKIAQFLDPDAKLGAYRLQYLRYALDLKVEDAQAHDALGDIRVLKALFIRLYEKMLKENSHEEVIEKMVEISKNPMEVKRINFGKYKGSFVKDIAIEDKGYLE